MMFKQACPLLHSPTHPSFSSILELLGLVIPDVSTITPSTDLTTLPSSLEDPLRGASAAAAPAIALTVVYQPSEPAIASYHHVPDYSSYGPTSDGRIKPDIVAPGWFEVASLTPEMMVV